ncbi:hypothetical protein [Streptomyces sp. ISL-11]|uniref:hypothetical protein n=1 Tax=Streptomyces sp. ISL-11 TaxID=2819174 RepID=UPI001BEA3BC4|nr:hypothetical protein [Streptomyces sp. ISL-11]MBT2383833.1 hypothetical protein [Streptomyces sp. ISL-11]
MRDLIARIQMWMLRLLLPSRGRHARKLSAEAESPVSPLAPPVGWQAEPHTNELAITEADQVFWYDEPLVRDFVRFQEEQREAERLQEEEDRLRKAHRRAALLAAVEGHDYPDVLYLHPDTRITPARAWTATSALVGTRL